MSTPNPDPRGNDPARQPVSRRGFLEQSAAAALAAGVVAGCSSQGEPAKLSAGGQADASAKAAAPAPNHVHAEKSDGRPALTREEGLEIIKQFEAKLTKRDKFLHGFHRIQAMTGPNDDLFVEVYWDEDPGEKPGRAQPQIPNQFEYTPPGGRDRRRVRIEMYRAPVLEPNIRIGHKARARNADITAYGTAGWNIRVGNKVVCMSARHTICSPFVNPTNSRVMLNESNCASIYRLEPIDPAQWNTYDLGLAQFDYEMDAEKQFVACDDGSRPYTYPMGFSSGIVTGQRFHKVGVGKTICAIGTLQGYLGGWGNIKVMYGATAVYYTGQMVLDPIAGKGDSGAVMVRHSDNTAAGVHFTSDADYSYSCPIFLLGWQPAGNYTIPGTNRTIPSFTIAQGPG